ncbi:hypothetical protein TNCV_4907821 [Trichonephila clavipes]|uniref:Uncharacterized protein n=1 Tax=Trichonephila clavipes TaxID=2585209 RepID=A0A8X6RSA6_TRICX|nr:hypothetical protein TNCV_4907821 [Trichonephila clavipes]
MRARNYYAHPNIRDHRALRCMSRCPDLVVCLKRDLQCLRPQASLVLIYRPNVEGMKGRVDLAQPVNRTQDLLNTTFQLYKRPHVALTFIDIKYDRLLPLSARSLGIQLKISSQRLSAIHHTPVTKIDELWQSIEVTWKLYSCM